VSLNWSVYERTTDFGVGNTTHLLLPLLCRGVERTSLSTARETGVPGAVLMNHWDKSTIDRQSVLACGCEPSAGCGREDSLRY